jgi:Ca2+-binding RTX toxin-like protein
MLWLAGLMGLMAVGAVTFVDPQTNGEEDDDASTPAEEPTPTTANASLFNTVDFFPPEDNFEPDYDPRGGDDAALLAPFEVSDADRVTLSEGTQGADDLDGDVGNDRIRGYDGADALSGGGANDELRGDAGNDTLGGDAGNDTLHGHDGHDVMHGGAQDDDLYGHNENDILRGEDGNDALQGSAGNDHLEGGAGDDTLQGGLDDDTLSGGAGSDALFGGWGNDVLDGLMRNAGGGDDDGADFLNGGGGDDSILAGSGDIVTAGEGADDIVLGDWLATGETAQIMDYTAAEDSLVLIWDDSEDGSVAPSMTLGADPNIANQTLVFLDGTPVAVVNGSDLLPGDIALIPLSTAAYVGLASA